MITTSSRGKHKIEANKCLAKKLENPKNINRTLESRPRTDKHRSMKKPIIHCFKGRQFGVLGLGTEKAGTTGEIKHKSQAKSHVGNSRPNDETSTATNIERETFLLSHFSSYLSGQSSQKTRQFTEDGRTNIHSGVKGILYHLSRHTSWFILATSTLTTSPPRLHHPSLQALSPGSQIADNQDFLP